jgi:aryl-alcohol dehydrogenase-like predicted oxidoreductase
VWAYSPLIQGAFDRADRPLPGAYDHPGTTARLAVLGDVAGRLGVAPSVVVLAWLVSKRIKPILGVSSLEQLDSALAAGRLELDQELVDQLDAPA